MPTTTTRKPFTIKPWQRYINRRYYVEGLPNGAVVYFSGPWGAMSPTGDWHALTEIEQRLADVALEIHFETGNEVEIMTRIAEIQRRGVSAQEEQERAAWRRQPWNDSKVAFEAQLAAGRETALINARVELGETRRHLIKLRAYEAQLLVA